MELEHGSVGETVFEQWTSKIDSARGDLRAAQQAWATDKERRASSFWARVSATLVTTPAEAAVTAAEQRLTVLADEAATEVLQWVRATALAELSCDTNAARARQEVSARIESMKKQLEEVGQWEKSAQDATAALKHAENSCQSASTMEMIDAFSTNKGMSVMAYMDVSSARAAVSSASNAMTALVKMLPHKAQALDISVPDGLLDLIVALTIDPSFDFLAMANSSRLSAAAVQCKAAIARLEPLIQELEVLRVERQAGVAVAMDVLEDLERPFLARAIAMVPEAIGIEQPRHIVAQ